MLLYRVSLTGLQAEGIYRVSPPLHALHHLRAALDSDPNSVTAQDSRWDHHVFAASLKLFLRDLPTPVIPYDLYDQFVQAARKPNFGLSRFFVSLKVTALDPMLEPHPAGCALLICDKLCRAKEKGMTNNC